MGDLKEMLKFLKDTQKDLAGMQEKLNKIQTYFNENFGNVNQIRIAEIGFLQDEFFNESKEFPDKVRSIYQKQLKVEEQSFEKSLAELEKKSRELDLKFRGVNSERLKFFNGLKKKNKNLDKREEKIKERIELLDNDIEAYNINIDELNTGLGAVTNFFKMRKIQKKKEALLDKQAELMADIEDVRGKWRDASREFQLTEKEIMENWNDTRTELSIMNEKVETLKKNREIIIQKAAFVSTLGELKGDESFLAQKVKAAAVGKCKRCESENKENMFFCNYCGERFSDDRKDIMGSLVEVGELNRVHSSLQAGISESVSFLALMKGISKGVEEFIKSVESVKSSQDTYASLSTLKIDVPQFSKSFYEKIQEVNPKIDVKYFNLHPVEFSQAFKVYIDKVFTSDNIEKFFTKMGDELNKTTKEQWG